MANKLVKVFLVTATLIVSHGLAYRIGATLARERTPQSNSARERAAAPFWLTSRTTTSPLPAGDRCSTLRAQLADAQAENESLNARFDDSNRIWRSIFLGPDAADRSGDDEDSGGKTDNTDSASAAANAATPVQDPPPMCVARCDRIQKWANCGSPPS